jgi:hypothetical protein
MGSQKARVKVSCINFWFSEFPVQTSTIRRSASLLLEAPAHNFIPSRIFGRLTQQFLSQLYSFFCGNLYELLLR